MKATIDIERKEITFHDNYSLEEITIFIEELFPEDYLEWTINHGLVSWYTYPTYPPNPEVYSTEGHWYTDANGNLQPTSAINY